VRPGRHAARGDHHQLDHARANYSTALAAARTPSATRFYRYTCRPAGGLIGLLSHTHFVYSDGQRTTAQPDASHADAIQEHRGTLIEGIIEESEDESLMDRYLGGEEIDQAVLIKDLEKAVAHGSFFPVIPVCSATGVGTFELLEVATSGFPSPLEHPLQKCSLPPAPTAAAWCATRTGRCWPRW